MICEDSFLDLDQVSALLSNGMSPSGSSNSIPCNVAFSILTFSTQITPSTSYPSSTIAFTVSHRSFHSTPSIKILLLPPPEPSTLTSIVFHPPSLANSIVYNFHFDSPFSTTTQYGPFWTMNTHAHILTPFPYFSTRVVPSSPYSAAQ